MRTRITKRRKTKQKPRIQSVFPPAPSPRPEPIATPVAPAVTQSVPVPALPGVPRRAKWPTTEPEAPAQPHRRAPPAAPRPVCPPARHTRPHPRL